MYPLQNLLGKKIILASASPRRQQLLQGLELKFEVQVRPTDEEFPASLKASEIPIFIAKQKSNAFEGELHNGVIVITADTVVWIGDHVLNKPKDRNDAIAMLSELSGKTHQVFTAVCIKSQDREEVFCDETKVTFTSLSLQEIEHYVDHYSPFDKAGSYGAQDWIGLVAVQKLEGSYFNVMGLPVHLLYSHLKNF